MPPPDKNTSVFLDGALPHVGDLSHAETRRDGEFFSRKEHKDHKAGGPTSVSATIDRSGWKRVRLGEVCKPCRGVRVVRSQLSQGRYLVYQNSLIPLGHYDKCNTPANTTFVIAAGSAGEIGYCDEPFWAADDCFFLLPNQDVISKFLYYSLAAQQQHISGLVRRGSVPRLARDIMGNLVLTLPDMAEQEKIVRSLTAIDINISTIQSLVAKYEAIKKATVNLLLRPKVDWRIVPLGEICEVCSTRRVHESDWTDSGVPFYRARELVALNDGRSITPLHISEKLYNELIASSGTIRPGDLLVTGVGSIGVPYLVKENDRFYFKDGNIIWFKNRGEIWPDYFLHAFRSDHIQKQIMEMACVGTVGSYTITNGKRTLIALPPLDEQKRIVEILDSLDGTISGLKSQLAKAQDIKRGMMAYFFG